MRPVLYVGNRNYSSWSLRPWLALTWSGLPFEDQLIELDQEGYANGQIQEVLAVSPTGRVPAMQVGETSIWDSLAICEWAAEQAPHANLWPQDAQPRATARSLVCEMHSGFSALRTHLTCNIRRRVPEPTWNEETRRDIERIDAIFTKTRERFGKRGPYLFGEHPGIVDAFFTPVATRLRTYNVSGLSAASAAYRDTLLSTPAFLEWCTMAEREWKPFRRAAHDTVYG
jgi:glutathione S-transferase